MATATKIYKYVDIIGLGRDRCMDDRCLRIEKKRNGIGIVGAVKSPTVLAKLIPSPTPLHTASCWVIVVHA